MAAATSQEPHVCTSCLKAYQRRTWTFRARCAASHDKKPETNGQDPDDLLLRHRRRCRGLKKRPTRQKACHACVQAKAKCTNSQPCSRCAGRGVHCTYTCQASGPESEQSPISQEDNHDVQVGYQGTSFEGDGRPSWRVSNDTGGLPTFDLFPSLTTTPNFADADQPSDARHATQGVFGETVSSHVVADPVALLDSLPILGQAGLGSNECLELGLCSWDMIQALGQYPRHLLHDEFTTPCLHRSLYDEDVPDIATLARTSMAICCGGAMETVEGARFARHVMDVERQRLIASYATYSCMQQWDALHAMLVYSILELRPSHADGNDSWKQKSCSKGLKAPFLVKMTRMFIQSHNLTLGEDLMSQSHISMQSFQQWTVSETARRTIFLANIVHFLSNHDPETGRPSPYYEPLDDDLILNMPLPCSHALWTARTEQEWRLTMEYCQTCPSPTVDNRSSAFPLMSGCFTLKSLLVNLSHDSLRNSISSDLGLGSSDELRCFVILCAIKQFGHTQGPPLS